uniref:Uncharacterized protein n=1 Tax=viral metagenome TaxID=1070528 RepID=A0A6C0C5H8_9ZZZZ
MVVNYFTKKKYILRLMGGMISIALSYNIWKKHITIGEDKIVGMGKGIWTNDYKMLDEQYLMKLEDEKII